MTHLFATSKNAVRQPYEFQLSPNLKTRLVVVYIQFKTERDENNVEYDVSLHFNLETIQQSTFKADQRLEAKHKRKTVAVENLNFTHLCLIMKTIVIKRLAKKTIISKRLQKNFLGAKSIQII